MRITNFLEHIEDADANDVTDAAGFYTWGNQVIKHSDGMYYSFMNRWADTDGFDGWVHYNSIYVSDGAASSTGPFTNYRELTELKGQAWCADLITNQNVVVHDGTYYIFYVGSNYTTVSYPAVDSESRNNQQIGVATLSATENPKSGTWTPYASNPVLSPRAGEWDQNLVNNPSVYQDINGAWRMVYKSDYFTTKGDLRLGVATSSDLFTWGGRASEPNFGLNGQSEDPYVWREGDTWYAISKAFDSSIVPFGNGIFLTSTDGITFTVEEKQPAWNRRVNWDDDTSNVYSKEERPFVLVEDGVGTTYYAGILGGSNNSFNIGRPLSNTVRIRRTEMYDNMKEYYNL